MDYDTRQQFEHDLINRRITWLLNSQTVLFAALAIVFGKECNAGYELIAKTISCVGIIISFLIFVVISMGLYAKAINYKNAKKQQADQIKQGKAKPENYETFPLQWGVQTWITRTALLPDPLMPVIFCIAWIIIICYL